MEKGLIPWIVAAIILALAVNLAINAFTPPRETILKAAIKAYEAPNKTTTTLKVTTVTPSATASAPTQTKTTKITTPAPELAFKTPETAGVKRGGDWGKILSTIANIAMSMTLAAVAFLIFRPRGI